MIYAAIYALCVAYDAGIPLISGDDIDFFVQLNKNGALWHGLDFGARRFFPLAGWYQTFIAQFSSAPCALYVGLAVIFVAFAFCFYRLCKCAQMPRAWIFFAFVIITLHVGFVKIITQIVFPETTQIVFICTFLLCAWRFYESANCESDKILRCAESDKNGANRKSANPLIFATLALIFGNAVIYLKEVSFILIAGFGFFHCVFLFLQNRVNLVNLSANQANPNANQPANLRTFAHKNRKILAFDFALMFSGVIFLAAYAFFTHNASANYSKIETFSTLRTFVTLIFSAPLVFALLCAAIFRFARILKGEKIHAFWDSLALIALLYVAAFLVLGMGSFHYFLPSSILTIFYLGFFFKTYNISRAIRIIFALFLGGILLTNTLPLGLHYFTLNKAQNRNTNDAFAFLGDYIHANPNVNLYFDGFARGSDKAYNSWAYGAFFDILPNLFDTRDFDVRTFEENGALWEIKADSRYTFFNSDVVDSPKKGDLIILHFFSGKHIDQARITELESRYELLFKSANYPYFPQISVMSLGAFGLQKMGVKHKMSNYANPFKLPSQVYIFRAN